MINLNSPPSNILLQVKNLNLGFNFESGFYQVLHDVFFRLEKGKMLAIVGESGSGKTMSAMSVLNLLPKTARIIHGEVFFNGENLLSKTDKEMQKIRGAKIALIPQDPMTALNPLYTIENQLMEIINLHRSDIKNKKEFAIKTLEEVKIADANDRLKAYPHELSGGMKQRVIIAMALLSDADLIIADEPTTALDVTVQAQIMDLLNDIKLHKNKSIILITHDLALVSERADFIAVMYAGRIVEYSDKMTLFTAPKHPYTKALFNALPDMNSEKISPISGRPPSIYEKIDGCPFNPRCVFKTEICLHKLPKCEQIQQTCVACFNVQ